MRRVLALALTTTLCLLLCACSHSDTGALTKEIQNTYRSAKSIALVAQVTADYGERTYAFSLRCKSDAEAVQIEILAPESVAGLKARVAGGKTQLEYDGTVMDTGPLLAGGLSPAEGLPMMMRAWSGAYVSGAWPDKTGGREAIVLETDTSAAGSTAKTLIRTWFDKQTVLPLKAEILSDERRVIYCEFKDVVLG